MRGKSMTLIVIALGCGLVASIGISKILDRGEGKPAAVETKKIYVAVRDVDISEVFDADMLKLEEWPADKVPEGSVSDLEEVKGLAPNQRLYAGEVIRKVKLVDRDKVGGTSLKIPKGYRVQAVKVQAESSVGNLITPGDHVDVNVYLRKSANISQPGIQTILEDVRVFAVNAETRKDVDEDGNSINAKTISLIVKPPQQTKVLLLASRLGQISLSLRHPDDDTETVADSGTSLNDLFGGAGDKDATPDKDDKIAGLQEAGNVSRSEQVSNFLLAMANKGAPADEAQPEEVAKSEFLMEVLDRDGVKTYSLVDDDRISQAVEVVGDSGAAKGKADLPPAADDHSADDNDSAGDDDSTSGDDSTADSGGDA